MLVRAGPVTLALVTGIAVGACSPGSETSDRGAFEVLFVATAGDDKPVAGVRIFGNGQPVGQTDDNGELQAVVRAKDGSILRIRSECPAGFRDSDGESHLRLRRFRSVDSRKPGHLSVSLTCRASERMVAVVINTDGRSGLPVIMDGREVARTSERGVAHLALRLPPHSSVELGLDTTTNATLRPRSPTATFVVDDADSVFVFDQTFAEERPPPKRKKRRARVKSAVAPLPEHQRPSKLTGPERTWRRLR